MILLVDGSNLLGRSGLDRQATETKRALVRQLATFAHQSSAKVVLFFDGPPPPAFATSLGRVQVVFSGTRQADELIRERAESSRDPLTVVTSDRSLAARVKGRRVGIRDAHAFLQQLERTRGEGTQGDDHTDWESYFSDSENRNI